MSLDLDLRFPCDKCRRPMRGGVCSGCRLNKFDCNCPQLVTPKRVEEKPPKSSPAGPTGRYRQVMLKIGDCEALDRIKERVGLGGKAQTVRWLANRYEEQVQNP
jgi:hypothetical protein